MKPIVWRAIFLEGVLIMLTWGGGLLIGLAPWQEIELTWPIIFGSLLATLPLLGGMIWTHYTRQNAIVQLRHFVQQHVVPLFAHCSLFELMLIAILAGLGEELFFRGLLQTGLVNATSLWIGLILTSIIFGLLHFISPIYAVLAALVGVYWGLLFIVTGNLAVPILVHALYDFVALIYLVRMRSDPAARLSRAQTNSSERSS